MGVSVPVCERTLGSVFHNKNRTEGAREGERKEANSENTLKRIHGIHSQNRGRAQHRQKTKKKIANSAE